MPSGPLVTHLSAGSVAPGVQEGIGDGLGVLVAPRRLVRVRLAVRGAHRAVRHVRQVDVGDLETRPHIQAATPDVPPAGATARAADQVPGEPVRAGALLGGHRYL